MIALAYIACTLIWGTTFFAIRQCIGPGGYPTLASAALRFIIAAVLLWAAVGAFRLRPLPRGRGAWAWLGACAVLNTVGYALTYTAEERITGGLAAVLYGTFPLSTALLAAVTRTERTTRAALLGALVSLGGIVLISWERLNVSAEQFAGVAMMFGAIICSSSYNIIFKRHAQTQHPLATNAAFLGLTALGMSAVALVVERAPLPWPPPPGPTVALLYLAVVGSVLAFGAYFYLLKRVSLMSVASMSLLEPVVALFVDALWEQQRIAPLTYVGAAITLAGVGVGLLLGTRRGATAVAPAESR